MPSSYSTSLRVELQAAGENDSTWGDKTNVNLGTIIEAAIAGIATITLLDADRTLTVNYGAADEARNMILQISGSQTVVRNVIVPSVSKVYVVRNITSGGLGVTIKTQSGSGVVIPNGETQIVFCDGSSVVRAAGSTAEGSIVPSGLSTTESVWRLYGSLGLNRSESVVANTGVFAADGAAGSQYKLYYNGTLAGTWKTEAQNSTLTSVAINAEGVPLALQMNGVDALQVATDGTVDVAKTLTAAALVSTGSITANGNVTAFSDERLKTDWQGLCVSYSERLSKVKFGSYKRIDDNKRYAGVSAQELRKVLPEVVEEDENGMLSVAYGNAAMVSVIQLAREFCKLRDAGMHFVAHAKKMQDEVDALRKELAILKKVI